LTLFHQFDPVHAQDLDGRPLVHAFPGLHGVVDQLRYRVRGVSTVLVFLFGMCTLTLSIGG
jgi:hypothetical protein